ncbi:MAG: hypothetical protein SNJ82_00190, partial [Gemmataceae bacterium]
MIEQATADWELADGQFTFSEIPLRFSCQTWRHPRLDRPLEPTIRSAGLLHLSPWIRSLGTLLMHVTSHGWRFPQPPDQLLTGREESAPKSAAAGRQVLAWISPGAEPESSPEPP